MHCNDQITSLEKEFSLTDFYFQINGISLGALDGGWSFDSLSHCSVHDCHHCGLSYYLQKAWLPWSVCIFTIFWGNLRLKLSIIQHFWWKNEFQNASQNEEPRTPPPAYAITIRQGDSLFVPPSYKMIFPSSLSYSQDSYGGLPDYSCFSSIGK